MRHPRMHAVLFAVVMMGSSPAEPAGDRNDASPTTELGRHSVTNALLSAIAAWLSAEFQMPEAGELPRVEFVPAQKLVALRVDGLMQGASSSIGDSYLSLDLVAVYHDARRMIYFQEGWSSRSPADVSVLVHEMVHHLQNVGELKYECTEAREKPAYVAQTRWLSLHGKSLEGEFDLDPMTLLVRTACQTAG